MTVQLLTFRVVAKVNYNSLTGTLRRLVLDALVLSLVLILREEVPVFYLMWRVYMTASQTDVH